MNKLLFPLLAIVAALGLYFVYIGPTYDQIKLHEAEEEEFNKALSEISEVKDILDNLESKYSNITREDLIRLELFLPKEIDIARVVYNIGGIVESYGVPMEDIEIRTESGRSSGGEASLREHEVKFIINSTYEDFQNIISDIETNIQIATVESIELQGKANSSENDFVTPTTYEIGLKLYSFE